MVSHSCKLALWGSLSYSEWTVVWSPSKRVSIKLERLKKGRERERERLEREGERVLSFVCMW